MSDPRHAKLDRWYRRQYTFDLLLSERDLLHWRIGGRRSLGRCRCPFGLREGVAARKSSDGQRETGNSDRKNGGANNATHEILLG